jgi:hypothetical protein
MISESPDATPSNSSSIKVPQPAGITDPESENPSTMFSPGVTVNPAANASPPCAETTTAPSMRN